MKLTSRKPRFWSFGLLLALPLAASTVRIIQTNSAGDDVSIIDPATNKVVGVIRGIEVSHGAAVAPDGSRYYISNEAESTLDVVDQKTLKVTRQGLQYSEHSRTIDDPITIPGIVRQQLARRFHRSQNQRVLNCHDVT